MVYRMLAILIVQFLERNLSSPVVRTMAEWVGHFFSVPEFMGTNTTAGLDVQNRSVSTLIKLHVSGVFKLKN